MKKYTITLDEKQIGALQAALEVYFRCCMGQIQTVAECSPNWIKTDYNEREDAANHLKAVLFPELPRNGYHSIGSDKILKAAKRAVDLHDVVRHFLSWEAAGWPQERDWRTMLGVNYDEPFNHAGEPLPTMARISE